MVRVALAALTALVAVVPAAQAAFPYKPQGAVDDYSRYRLPKGPGQTPNDLGGKLSWMYSSTAEPGAGPLIRNDPRELYGVRGAHLVDPADVDQAWHTTTGRPDVTIAVLDSGIKWNDLGGMLDVRKKTRINRGETPAPQADRATSTEPGENCATYGPYGPHGAARDLNGDGVFNIVDYACDSRVDPAPARGVGPTLDGAALLDPQDILIAFTDGDDDDGNGYADDMVGWDFLDNDNDPFDDVQYSHGTGQSRDSAAEADNGGDLGSCPNCMEIHLRVGTSFIADVNRFALAVLYATDNDVEIVQEALGTINKSRIGGDAVKYAYDHGTVVIASAADEAAQHHNWPSSYPYSIVVNSVTHEGDLEAAGFHSYLQFNGCTNFSSRITLAIPSVSCSSDATGRAAGMAGIVYSAALNAMEAGKMAAHPTCRRTNGDACPVSPNEVRQVMASGTLYGEGQADDVDFTLDPATGMSVETSCFPVANPGCTDPFIKAPTTRKTSGLSYPAGLGHDQFYGYGRVNMTKAVQAIVRPSGADAQLPPEVEVTSPGWYEMVDPAQPSISVTGQVFNRGKAYSCRVYVAPGSYPKDSPRSSGGDFTPVPSPVCDGTARTAALDGELASLSTADLKALFPAIAGDFTGREPGLGEQTHGGRPNTEPYGFVVKVVAKSVGDPIAKSGEDRRNAYLHHDTDLLPGFPKQLSGDGEASPVLADLDGDNRNELLVANSDGVIHGFRRDGSELAGWPVRSDPLPAHLGARAFSSGEVANGNGAVLATPAVGDLDRDGVPEIVVADVEGRVYILDPSGQRIRVLRTVDAYSGRPQAPFANSRGGEMNRTQHGFIASPVLADLDGDGELEIIAGALDRHVYAWHLDGSTVDGWPVLVVDRDKVASIDPDTHQVAFKERDHYQGAIVDTPAVGDLDGDGRPEVVVGTNEPYSEPLNAGGLDKHIYDQLAGTLELANGRLYAIPATGEPGGPKPDSSPWLPGWPFKVGILQAEVLPLVGEGITGAPIIGDVPCNGTEVATRIGVVAAAGLPYLVNPDGQSCLGRQDGLDVPLPTYGGAATDQPFLSAFGNPAFGTLAGQPSFLTPAAGIQRALDVVLPEYQGGKDYLVAWNTATGKIAPGWPAEMNDLQFLTGPSIADLDGLPGTEVVNGSANDDLQAFTAAGTDVSASWPKLTGDWTVANPAVGSFGTLDTDADAKKVVIGLTRSGRVNAYGTGAGACTHADWPQFHHDPANSGDARRDAVSPGRAGRARHRGRPAHGAASGGAGGEEGARGEG